MGEEARADDFGGFVALVGIVVEEAGPERVAAHLEADERHHQPHGLVHGGVYASIVETLASIGAYLAAPRGAVMVGVSNSTDFLRAHRHGRLDAVAVPVHVGRTAQLWEVRITRASDGALVARGQVRLQRLPDGAA